VVAGWGSSPGRVAREREKKRRKEEEVKPFGQNSFEF
jgi:hypothetical protein